MSEAARQNPDPEVLRMIEGDQLAGVTDHAAMLKLLSFAQAQFEAGADPEAIQEILTGLETALKLLPSRPRIIELPPLTEKEKSPGRKQDAISERLVAIRIELSPQATPNEGEPNPLLHEAGTVVSQNLRVLGEIQAHDAEIRGELRDCIRENLNQILTGEQSVTSWLRISKEVFSRLTAAFVERDYEKDHPLFKLWKGLAELQKTLPNSDQLNPSGFTRVQMKSVRSAIQDCLSKIAVNPNEPDENVEKLLGVIQKRAMNPGKGPAKSNQNRAKEQANNARQEIQRKMRKDGKF